MATGACCLYSCLMVGGYYMSNESEYISSAHPPVQLHSNGPKPWVLDTHSMVGVTMQACRLILSWEGSFPQKVDHLYITRSKKFSSKNKKDLGMACHTPPL